VLEAVDDVVWVGFGAGLVPGFDCALSCVRKTKLKATAIKIDGIRFMFKIILLYCGFFSFFAARYPAAMASDSDMYFPLFVFP